MGLLNHPVYFLKFEVQKLIKFLYFLKKDCYLPLKLQNYETK